MTVEARGRRGALSHRLPQNVDENALSRAVRELRASGIPFVDLTESNPTRAGFEYPADLLAPMGDARSLVYDPHPLGSSTARQAVAADAGRRGVSVDPGSIVLTASTSEAYSWLFKVLCDDDDHVLVPRPSYPLFEHLTRLEGVRTMPYDLEYHGRWEIDFTALAAAPAGTRAVLVVSPNNPTGSYVSASEASRLADLCKARGWALIVDEVFADYPLDVETPQTDLASRLDVLTFSLGGASKSLGLPQVKLGWIVVGGPGPQRRAALEALEIVADTFLSVNTPVQTAASHLLAAAAGVRHAIHARVRANLARARHIAGRYPASEVLRVEGGWSAVVRVPTRGPEDALVMDLLRGERVLVHPGYFFDFARESYLVVSLLPPEETFADGFERVLRRAS